MSRDPEVRRGGGLPFGQVVSQWVCDPRYTTNLRTLYTILVTYADIGARDTARGRPYRTELAAQLGASVKTLDRTLLEGECAGIFWIERRSDPLNPKLNDANVYHLRDAEFWRGEWADPLPSGRSAAEVAATVVAQRVEEKRKAGIAPTGGRRKKHVDAPAEGVASPVTPPRTKGGGVMGDARGGDMGDAGVASPVTPKVYSPVENPDREPTVPSVRPSPEAGDAHARIPDGGTDGVGEVIEGREQVPAARDVAPGFGSAVRPVHPTPGVEVLRAVAAEAPQWTITHADSLRDQGLVATGMLDSGFTAQEIRHALLSKPLPQPVRTTVGAVVARRLRDLIAVGPAAGARPIPVQQTGDPEAGCREPEIRDATPVPAALADKRAQLDAEIAGVGRHRPCAGDEGLCPRLALPGTDLCSACLGGEQPSCAGGCGREVVAEGAWCPICAEPPTPADKGDCPGHGGKQCGRAIVTAGLCRTCRFEAEVAKLAAQADWEAARDAAVAAAQAADSEPGLSDCADWEPCAV
ncbi:hypothetical protein ACH4A8_40005 [Streptomyces vietnamensis]|uniref:hypothetical protein n=1 Tax=Streptomyces vietnamensis TaxID=362257 RepID=UPI0037966A08